MVIPSIEKQLMVEEVTEMLRGDGPVFFSRLGNISAEGMNELRKSLHSVSKCSVAVKNTLLRRSLAAAFNLNQDIDFLQGQMFVTVSDAEPQEVSKKLVTFANEKKNIEVCGGVIDGRLVPSSYVVQLSKLPSREQLIATVVGGIKAPISNFVLTLSAVIRNLAIVVKQISEQRESKA